MTIGRKETVLKVTDIPGFTDILVDPNDPDGDASVSIEQDNDVIRMDREAARLVGEFLIEWAMAQRLKPESPL